MIWDDTGFLLSKNRYSENSLIAEIYTKIMEKSRHNFWWNLEKIKITFKLEIKFTLIIIQNLK